MDRLKVLVVDDEPIIAIDISDIVLLQEFDLVGKAHTSTQALELVQEHKPDIILMDINLNEETIDGIELVKKIQQLYEVHIIYITAYSDENTIDKAVQTDPLGYIIKPFEQNDISSILKLASFKIKKEKTNQIDNSLPLGNGYFYHQKDAKLYYDSFAIELTHNEITLIELLINARGTIVPFEVIDMEIWPEFEHNDSRRRTLIYRLNSKLEHKIIKSFRGIGCKIDTELTQMK